MHPTVQTRSVLFPLRVSEVEHGIRCQVSRRGSGMAAAWDTRLCAEVLATTVEALRQYRGTPLNLPRLEAAPRSPRRLSQPASSLGLLTRPT